MNSTGSHVQKTFRLQELWYIYLNVQLRIQHVLKYTVVLSIVYYILILLLKCLSVTLNGKITIPLNKSVWMQYTDCLLYTSRCV